MISEIPRVLWEIREVDAPPPKVVCEPRSTTRSPRHGPVPQGGPAHPAGQIASCAQPAACAWRPDTEEALTPSLNLRGVVSGAVSAPLSLALETAEGSIDLQGMQSLGMQSSTKP